MTVKETFAQLRLDLKTMTFGQKVEHIWTNFKEWILIVGSIVLLLTLYLCSVLTAKDPVLSVYYLNVGQSSSAATVIGQDFLSTVGDPDREKVSISSGTYRDSDMYAEDNYTLATQLGAMVSAGTLDVVICDSVGLALCQAMDICLDLQTVLPAQQQEALGELLTTGLDSELVQTDILIAVDISQTVFAAKELVGGGEYYLCLSVTAEHKDNCVKLLEYILNYE